LLASQPFWAAPFLSSSRRFGAILAHIGRINVGRNRGRERDSLEHDDLAPGEVVTLDLKGKPEPVTARRITVAS
jgi:hypothetical protein